MVHTSPLCALGLEFISLMGWNVTSIFYTTVENFLCSKRIVFQGFWNWQKYTKVNRTRHLWVFISIIKLPWYKSCWCSHTQSMPRCPNTPTLLDKLSKHQIYCHNSSVNRKIRFIVPIHRSTWLRREKRLWFQPWGRRRNRRLHTFHNALLCCYPSK